jgi:hypothetical protein
MAILSDRLVKKFIVEGMMDQSPGSSTGTFALHIIEAWYVARP